MQESTEIKVLRAGEIVLDIDKINALRAKRGRKPLPVKANNENSKSTEKGEIHQPPVNLADKNYINKLREKVALQRERRAYLKKLKKVKGLAQSEDDELGTQDWIDKTRKDSKSLDRNKTVSAHGVHKNQNKYRAKELKGMIVEHAQDSFEEGKSVILTLKDKGILDEASDVLENVNLKETEKWKRNTDRRIKKRGCYDPYDGKEKSLLFQYDEEIYGIKEDSFKLGQTMNRPKESTTETLKRMLESLNTQQPKLASDYLSFEEMKKRRKVRVKTTDQATKQYRLHADDLLDESHASDSTRKMSAVDDSPAPKKKKSRKSEVPSNDQKGTYVRDSLELEEILKDNEILISKVKKLQNVQRTDGIADLVRAKLSSKTSSTEETSKSATDSGIVFNSTAEFCRILGDIPTYGKAGNREENSEEISVLKEETKIEDTVSDKINTWTIVDGTILQSDDDQPETQVNVEVPILEAEPDIGKGIASTLQLVMRKGYLEKSTTKKQNNVTFRSSESFANYTIEDKEKFNDQFRGRQNFYNNYGNVSEFKEKKSYRPKVKLEYFDDSGRPLNQKEAFRHMSHKFHGMTPGKNKIAKRMKKVEEEKIVKKMSSIDTPLGMVALLQEKQKKTKSPFVVLNARTKPTEPPFLSKT